MAEMCWVTMIVGGVLPENLIGELDEIIEDGGWDDSDDIHDAVKEKRSLSLSGEQNYGNEENLEEFCAEHDLVLWKQYDGKSGQWSSAIQLWLPEEEKVLEVAADQEGGVPMLTLGELEVMHKEGKTIVDAIAHLGRFDHSKVPPLTFGPNKFVEPDPKEWVAAVQGGETSLDRDQWLTYETAARRHMEGQVT